MKGNFVDCFRLTLLIGKYIGIMPLTGLRHSREPLRFSWKSGYNIIYGMSSLILFFIISIQTSSFIKSGFASKRFGSLLLNGVAFIQYVLIFRFCQRIKDTVTHVENLEKVMPPVRKPRSTVKYINQFMCFFLLFSLGQYVSYLTFSIYLTHKCYLLTGESGLLKSYLILVHRWYVEHFSFSYVPMAVIEIIKLQATMALSYVDIIIMVACFYLINQFNNFNHLILNKNNMYTKTFKPRWSELQVHYTRISKLATIIDNDINAILFLSYTSNLFLIFQQMYFILNKLTGVNNVIESSNCAEHRKYDLVPLIFKFYTLTHTIVKTILVSYFAAKVNSTSRVSLMVLHTVPSSAFNRDMIRLMTQIYYSKIGISGLNFFQITSGMMLTMVTKLLTYELVLVQF